MDMDTESQVSIAKKLEQNEVAMCDVMMDNERDKAIEALIARGIIGMDTKGKSKLGFEDTSQHDMKDATSIDLGNSTSIAGLVDIANLLKGSTSGSLNSNDINSSNSDLSYHDDDEEVGDDYDDVSDYDDYLPEDGEDDYMNIESQFDSVDLPSGVEASLPWLKDPAPSGNTSGTSTSTFPDLSESKRKASLSDLAETKRMATISDPGEKRSQEGCTISSKFPVESSSNGEVEDNKENDVIQKFKHFKQFETVEDFSDHHFRAKGFSEEQPPKNWARRIQEEWKLLEKDLPGTISVRVYETRMELLRAIIVGIAGTPYHDGLFVFDCLFPPSYPKAPPMVYYYSGGLRLNPNLYECGKVCLSLLGTWSGQQTEMWIPGKSTMLQVLLSIQALILNAKPFFNEPGYERSYVGVEGDRRSNKYNEDVFILSLKTMMYTLRRPPKYFEDYVVGHFHIHAHDILAACKAYMNGATVGSVAVKDGVADVNNSERSASGEFQATVRKMINILVANFTRLASIDCEQFRISD